MTARVGPAGSGSGSDRSGATTTWSVCVRLTDHRPASAAARAVARPGRRRARRRPVRRRSFRLHLPGRPAYRDGQRPVRDAPVAARRAHRGQRRRRAAGPDHGRPARGRPSRPCRVVRGQRRCPRRTVDHDHRTSVRSGLSVGRCRARCRLGGRRGDQCPAQGARRADRRGGPARRATDVGRRRRGPVVAPTGSGTEELHADGHRLRDALLDALPAPVPPALVHGDYHYANLLFGPDGVVAVLDWEVAGLGDPRWDFGSLAVTVIRRKYDPEPNVTGDLDVSLADLARRFDATPDLAWFAGASCFKYTAILGYNRGLHLKGRRPDPVYDQLVGTISGLAADGLTVLTDGVPS
ncbi:MAG TPA: aminoglycoside phosphotransferase family protein [Pseudonocardiaceae bacterium]